LILGISIRGARDFLNITVIYLDIDGWLGGEYLGLVGEQNQISVKNRTI
jgi:hypothetical protein